MDIEQIAETIEGARRYALLGREVAAVNDVYGSCGSVSMSGTKYLISSFVASVSPGGFLNLRDGSALSLDDMLLLFDRSDEWSRRDESPSHSESTDSVADNLPPERREDLLS
jgi:hypothetical protein